MSVHIHVERLVLEGLALGPHEGRAVSRAIRQELARLVDAHGLELSDGFAAASAQGGSVFFDGDVTPQAAGRRIAAALFGALESVRR
jgi:hypothetical protein